jgi:hypothetical protein
VTQRHKEPASGSPQLRLLHRADFELHTTRNEDEFSADNHGKRIEHMERENKEKKECHRLLVR